MVVLVLMTSCHVSLKPKNGPDTAHARTKPTANTNVAGRPDHLATVVAKREKKLDVGISLIGTSLSHDRNAITICRFLFYDVAGPWSGLALATHVPTAEWFFTSTPTLQSACGSTLLTILNSGLFPQNGTARSPAGKVQRRPKARWGALRPGYDEREIPASPHKQDTMGEHCPERSRMHWNFC